MGDIDDYSGMVPNTAADTASPASLSRFEFVIASILYQRRTTGSDKEDQDELPSGNHVVVVEYWCRQDYLDLQVHSDIHEEWSTNNLDHTQTTITTTITSTNGTDTFQENSDIPLATVQRLTLEVLSRNRTADVSISLEYFQ